MIRIGIVDDHPVFRLGLRRALERDKRLVVAWDLGEASKLNQAVASSHVELVLLDLNLGTGPDGLAATRALLREHPHVKVVILTASADPESASAARRAGATAFMVKDLLPDELATAIANVASANGKAAAAIGPSESTRVISAAGTFVTRGLTRRQREVLNELRRGRTNREIASRLGVSVPTVNKHVQQVLKQFNARSRSQVLVRLGEERLYALTQAE